MSRSVVNKDGSVTTYFDELEMPKGAKSAESKVVEPEEKPAAKTRSRASSK